MIKCELEDKEILSGTMEVRGDKKSLVAEFTTILKYFVNRFGVRAVLATLNAVCDEDLFKVFKIVNKEDK